MYTVVMAIRYGRFEQFSQALDHQRVTVDQRILEAGHSGRSSLPFSLEPTGILAAIAEAGRVLRKEPGRPLADQLITPSRKWRHDASQMILCRMINTSIAPDVHTTPALFSAGTKGMDTCNITERLLQVTVDLLRQPRDSQAVPIRPGCQVIHEGERATFLREALGERVCLALTEFSINGVWFPPGSLARVDVYGDTTIPVDGRQKIAMPEEGVHVVPLDQVERAAFIRLSAFALPPEQRSPFRTDTSAIAGWERHMPQIIAEPLETIAASIAQVTGLSTGT